MNYVWPMTAREGELARRDEHEAVINQARALERIADGVQRIAKWCERNPVVFPKVNSRPIEPSKPIDPTIDDLLKMSIEELDYPCVGGVRLYNCLKNAEIRTVGDLILHTQAELMRRKNFGKVCLRDLQIILAAKQLSLGTRFDAEAGQFVPVRYGRADPEDHRTCCNGWHQFAKSQ